MYAPMSSNASDHATATPEACGADCSIRDHEIIIKALEMRDTARAEELVRSHALGLAEQLTRPADNLDLNDDRRSREVSHG